jgi:ABC-type branched-subunit amino acid transport system substrate-binding protein
MKETRPLVPGDPSRLGEYVLVGRLGEGGQGTVFLGRDGAGAEVAVKLLRAGLSEDPASRARFVRELAVAERVAGFCTAQVLDADVAGDQPYIVSEYVPGPSLQELVAERGPRGGTDLDRLAIGTATALTAIHQAGIVHRDFKPPNVLMGPDGPRVIDFGIARALDLGSSATSQAIGTPAYMAPEQVSGDPIGPAADLFAWGATMLYAVSGTAPFAGGAIAATMHRVLHFEPDLDPLPQHLRPLIAACLRKDPAERPGAQEVLLRLLGLPAGSGDTDIAPMLAQATTLAAADLTVADRPAPLGPRGRSRRLLLPAAAAGVAAAIAVPFVLWPDGGTTGGGGGSPVRLAVTAPLGGDSPDRAAAQVNAVKLAVAEYNGRRPRRKVEVVPLDLSHRAGGSRAAESTAVAAQIAGKGVSGVIGLAQFGEADDAQSILEQARIPVISPGYGRSFQNELQSAGRWRYWHGLLAPERVVAGTAATVVARELEPARAFVVDQSIKAEFPYGAMGDSVMKALSQAGVTATRVELEETSEAAAISKITAAGADVVFFQGRGDMAGSFARKLRQADATTRFVAAGLPAFSPAFSTTEGGRGADGALLACACLWPDGSGAASLSAFIQRYQRAYGRAPESPSAAEFYDAANAFLLAIAAGKTTGEQINIFLSTANVTGVTRKFRFNEHGDPVPATVYLYQMKKGRQTLLGDASTVKL